jgi:hypothetical protein
MSIVKWSLVSGGKPGQETKDMKKQEGLAYIERLKEDERVISFEETDKELIINLE